MIWERHTSAEIGALDRATPVVLSIAAIEQHGPHLALATDAVIGGHFLDALDGALGERVLILPQVKVGCSEHHMSFPGTLSVSHEAFAHYVGDIVRSVIRHGFTNVVLFNSHGGNQGIGQVLLESLGAEHPHARIAFLTWWRLAAPELRDVRESPPGVLGHACELETSLMMCAAPGDVRAELIAGPSAAPTFDWALGDLLAAERGTLHRTMAERTGGTGTNGDPSLASTAKGETIMAAVLPQLVNVIETLAAAPAKTAAQQG